MRFLCITISWSSDHLGEHDYIIEKVNDNKVLVKAETILSTTFLSYLNQIPNGTKNKGNNTFL